MEKLIIIVKLQQDWGEKRHKAPNIRNKLEDITTDLASIKKIVR